MFDKIYKILGLVKSKDDKYSELRSFPLFADLNPYEMYQVSNICHKRSYAKNEQVFDKGFPLEAVFFILNGEIELTGSTQPGGQRRLGKGEQIGLIDLFYKPIRQSKAIAIKETNLLAVSREDFLDLVARNPRLGVKILSTCCKLLSTHVFDLAGTGEEQ